MGSSCSTQLCCSGGVDGIVQPYSDPSTVTPNKYVVIHRTPSAVTRKQERALRKSQKHHQHAATTNASPLCKSASSISSSAAALSHDSSISITVTSTSAHQFDPVTMFSEGDEDDVELIEDNYEQHSTTPSTVIAVLGGDSFEHSTESASTATHKAPLQQQLRSTSILNSARNAAANHKQSNSSSANNNMAPLVTFCATVAVLSDDTPVVEAPQSTSTYLQVTTTGGGADDVSASDATDFSDDRPFTPSTPTPNYQTASNASFSSIGHGLSGIGSMHPSTSTVQHRPLLPQNIPHRLQQARQTSLVSANLVRLQTQR